MTGKDESMRHAQRVRTLLKKEKPDRIPIWPFFDMGGFAAVYYNRPISDAYRDPGVSLELQRSVCEEFGWISSPFFLGIEADDFGGERRLPESNYSQAPSTIRFPIESEEDVVKIKMPDIPKTAGISRVTEFNKMVIKKKYDHEPFRLILQLPTNPFDMAGRICRLEMLTRWMIKKPEIVHRLIRFSQDILLEILNYWYDLFGSENVLVRSGGVICSNQIISPKHFEEFVLPYLKENHEKVLSKGYNHFYCHICGEHNMNMPYWSHVPMGNPGIVSIGHEVELEVAARCFPDDIILGNMNPAIMQTGSPDDVYKSTAEVINKGKKLASGFIFSMGCQFPPRSSLANVRAMNQAIYDFGRYE